MNGFINCMETKAFALLPQLELMFLVKENMLSPTYTVFAQHLCLAHPCNFLLTAQFSPPPLFPPLHLLLLTPFPLSLLLLFILEMYEHSLWYLVGH